MIRITLQGLLTTLLFTACGFAPPAESGYIHPELYPYVAKFAREGNLVLSAGLQVDFGGVEQDDNKDTVSLAVCYMQFERIVVDRDSWNLMNSTEREVLMYHELGHCVLGRYHPETMLTKRCPTSIMHPLLPTAVRCYNERKDYYIQELFNGGD